MNTDLPWRAAIIKILEKTDSAMHYNDIADEIVSKGLRQEVGATPARTVNYVINKSIKNHEENSPFLRVAVGEYFLRETTANIDDVEDESLQPDDLDASTVEEDSTGIVQAFGMYWGREQILWTNSSALLGRQQPQATIVNFAGQRGVYLLHDNREVIYVGRATDRSLALRLFEHTYDRLNSRWNRFSWFGLFRVTEDGNLIEEERSVASFDVIIATMEAILIEGLEPPQNRRRGEGFRAVEYLQVEDPKLKEQKVAILMDEIKDKLMSE